MGIGIGRPNGVVAAVPEAQERCCSRCRRLFPATDASRHVQPGEWWLCAACHDKLIGPGSRVHDQGRPHTPGAGGR
jgi:hypothetical protein